MSDIADTVAYDTLAVLTRRFIDGARVYHVSMDSVEEQMTERYPRMAEAVRLARRLASAILAQNEAVDDGVRSTRVVL